MQKSIGMLLDGFYPSDIRVQKEARALIDAGFKVALLCKRRKDEAYYESFEGIELMRIDAGTSHSAKGIIDIIVGNTAPCLTNFAPDTLGWFKNKHFLIHLYLVDQTYNSHAI